MTSIQRNSLSQTFWFSDEEKTFSGFCRTAARRTAIALPLAVTFSSSATIALTYLTGVLWLLGGHWKERCAIVRSSGILLASIPLILWTGIGILRYEDSFWESLRYWFGHYPYIFILVMATLLTKKEHRGAIVSSMNLAIVLCCLWAVGFAWYYADLSPWEFLQLRIKSIYLYRNTICFGVALALWSGLWAFLPYSSRHVGWVRHVFPRTVLDAMEAAASLSLVDLFRPAAWPTPPKRGLFLLAGFLAALRWGIVLSVVFYLFSSDMSSRTAQLAVLAGYSAVLILWNWKKGIAVVLILLLPFAFVAGSLSDKTQRKIAKTINDVQQAAQSLPESEKIETFIRTNTDRLSTQMALFPDLVERPLVGHGMEKARKLTLQKTRYVDPHNEFFYMMLQHGLIGLGCFLFWIMAPFVHFRHLPVPWNRFGLFLAVIVTIDCLFNNAMSYHRETYLLCIGFALPASMVPVQRMSNDPKTEVETPKPEEK